MNAEQQLSEANARMAMMDEALKAAKEYVGKQEVKYLNAGMFNGKSAVKLDEEKAFAALRILKKLDSALSTSPESLKKWEAEKLLPLQQKLAGSENMVSLQAEAIGDLLKRIDEIEPLQRQVAMLWQLLDESWQEKYLNGIELRERCNQALANTQATAEAFVLEIEQRAIERYKLEKQ